MTDGLLWCHIQLSQGKQVRENETTVSSSKGSSIVMYSILLYA